MAIGVLSRGILRIPSLETLLDAPVAPVSPVGARIGAIGTRAQLSAVAGWGLKPTAQRAREYAARHGLPYLALEDGFLRSVGLGTDDPPLSLIVDDQGVYYDATHPSRLETLIQRPLSAAEASRARALRGAWREARVSKYNHLPEQPAPLPHPAVLVVDQTLGDPAIAYGLANPKSFQHMLEAALDEHPEATIVLKIHPDVFAGRKRGHFDPRWLARHERHGRLQVLSADVHPAALLEQVTAVYTVTSQMGFEALLWGRTVRTFGMPFYAGWGLTEDELPAPARRAAGVRLESLIHAALIEAPRYLDPETGARCEVERLVAWMGLQRRLRTRFAGPLRALGFSAWKRPLVAAFLQGSDLRFSAASPPKKARREMQKARDAEETLVVWGLQATPARAPTLRLEDGFLRSVGLGADLIRPLSWVIDGRGLYYDASRPSDLEVLLQETRFDQPLLTRARALRERIVTSRLTKYNLEAGTWQRPAGIERVILVPGQVESDASLKRSTPDIRRNLDLLKRVRAESPEAYLVYKPHPDVLAGLRARGEHEQDAQAWCDEILSQAPMGQLLEQVDAVHVLTSLAGFEALLRGKEVVCHGQPFYAGWGLTQDRAPLARRQRQLALDELVAGALLLYPTYVSRITGRYTTAERALEELLAWRAHAQGLPWWRRALRPLLGYFAHGRGAPSSMEKHSNGT